MKKLDKLKRQRYEISMKIIKLEEKVEKGTITKNELKELEILRQKEMKLDEIIND